MLLSTWYKCLEVLILVRIAYLNQSMVVEDKLPHYSFGKCIEDCVLLLSSALLMCLNLALRLSICIVSCPHCLLGVPIPLSGRLVGHVRIM